MKKGDVFSEEQTPKIEDCPQKPATSGYPDAAQHLY